MSWKKSVFGTMPDGSTADKYILTNQSGVSAAFTDLGGIWLGMAVPGRDGKMADVVLGCGSVEGCMNQEGHLGEIVGRNANRISGAAFCLNGKTYRLDVNSGAADNLHSGLHYYRNRLWEAEVEEHVEVARLREAGAGIPEKASRLIGTGGKTEAGGKLSGTKITFRLDSPDGDQGYPGNAKISVSYTLAEDNSVRIDYHMVSDTDTVANLTNHAYFNLAGHDSGTVLGQKVWIDADFFTPTDEHLIPTGELLPVKGTPMDFTSPKPIGQDIGADYRPLILGNGYDHNWALNHAPGVLSLSAKAMDEISGRVLEVWTDLPGIQFYAGNMLEEKNGKNGTVYKPRCGYCFETQYFPDAINQPQFSSPVLKAGEGYRTTTVYRFSIVD